MKILLFFSTGLLLGMSVVGCETQRRPNPAAQSSAGRPLKAAPVVPQDAKPGFGGILPSFRMIGPESGFDFERYDDIRGLHRILEVNGGGVGLLDFDRDGWLDVFMTNGCRLPLKDDDNATRCELFANKGAMQFRGATDSTRLIQHGYTHGCAVGDYDNDGFQDLYVTAFGHNAMWHNNGDGTFADVTEQTGTDVPKWSSSAAFADLNGDGNLDLYVVNYLEESDESPRLCPKGGSPDGYEQCSPAMFDGADDVMFLSDGSGQFLDATEATGLQNLRGKGLGVVVCDLDRDGRQEIFVANDGQANYLFSPTKEATNLRLPVAGVELKTYKYDERALLSNAALSEAGYAQANMGIAAGDYDANGTTDLLITHFYADTSTLYSNLGGLLFTDATRASKLGAPSRNRLGWGVAFCDTDNNGWLDLIVANGHVDDRTWMKQGEPYKMRPQLFLNQKDGSFGDASEWAGQYFQEEWLGRGLATGDLDRDGQQDFVVSHQLGRSCILRNETPTRDNSLLLQLVGTNSSRDSYGARVEVLSSVPMVVRELIGGGSFQSASATELHLGLGKSESVSLRITWPSGLVEVHDGLRAGQWVVIEGKSSFSLRSPNL